MGDQIIILALHRVGKPARGATIRGLFISERLLRFQIGILRTLGFRFTTLREAMSDGPGRKAVLTFDDGYEDNLTRGLPVLEAMRVTATLFAITSDIGKRDCTWEEAGDKTPADMLSWEQIEHLQAKGWEIGAHADEHVHLGTRNVEDQKASVASCVAAIQRRLGAEPVSFAYPYGSYTEATKDILRSMRIRFAVTTDKPAPGELTPSADQLQLKRLAVGGWAWHHFFRVAIRTLAVVGLHGMLAAFVPGRTQLLSPIFQFLEK